jgi:O-antigen/teichoic acid export membrane protein
LEKEQIRTHYSGSILFVAKLISVATGIVFTLTVANALSQNDYGAWGIFNINIIPYFTLFSGPIPFWVMRFVARDKEGATKTGIVGNMSVALIAAIVYLALFPVITTSFGLENYIPVYLVAVAQIIETYLIAVFEACLQARRPHFVGYGLLVGEVLKVLFVYMLVVRLQLAVLGAILSIALAFAVKIAFYFRVIWKEIQRRIVFSYITEWLKGSLFNLYNVLGNTVASIIFIMLTVYGGTIGQSYYYASLQIASVIGYSTFLAFALQPKLLADPNIDEATVSLKIVLMFAIPMTAGVLAIPGSYLIFLKESGEYVVAAPVLMILAVDTLVSTISTIYTYVLYGIEKVDEKAEVPLTEVMRSRLFVAFSLPYAHSAITLPITYHVLTNFASNNPMLVATYVTGINTIGHVAMFIVLYYVLRKAVKFRVPWKSIGKYVAASSVMALVLFSVHPIRRSTTLLLTAIGGLAYVALLMGIDKETRTLTRTVLQTVTKRVKRGKKPEASLPTI